LRLIRSLNSAETLIFRCILLLRVLAPACAKIFGEYTMKDKIIRTPEVSKIIGLAIPTIQAKANPNSSSYDPGFPKAIRVGKRALGFNESEVKAWLDAQRVTGGVSDGNYTLTETWVRTLPIIGVLLVGRCRYQPIFSDCDLETPFRDYFFTDWLGMPPKPECEIELETTGGFITIPESLDHCIRTYCPMSGDRFYFHQLFMDKYKPCQLTKEATTCVK